ncbi:MAG TPA: beta-CASP ribonuclease aCPSF1 [Thermoplasmata archaeon]|nr:beta-CASP ribonuclease aCPSF1 [Thermoplasmata archaeon]
MNTEEILKDIKRKIRAMVPSSIEITSIEFEAAQLVVYTSNTEELSDNRIIKELAKTFQKHIIVRPDPSILIPPEEAEREIKKIIPDELKIKNIYFDPTSGDVTIEVKEISVEAEQRDELLKEIKRSIGWIPHLIPVPPIPSATIKDILAYQRSIVEDRKQILRQIGKRIHKEVGEHEKWVRLTALGGFREVGRSCSMLSTPVSKVLIDCGMAMGESQGSPYINLPEVLPFDSLDAVVITHAHLDHSAIVPLLYKYGYKGPVYCTYPTRDLMTLLQMDYLKVAASNGSTAPYGSTEIREVIKHSIPLNYGFTTDITPDVRLTLHNAGHILGSAIAHFHIGEGLYNIVFTGDMKYEKTWLFNPTINRFPRIETLVMESTYGSHKDFQPRRRDAPGQLAEDILQGLKKKGKILIPVFAVGRSQEVMVVLEQLIRDGIIPEVPIYLDGMIWEATAIHTAYPQYLNNELKQRILYKNENPFLSPLFERVDSVEKRVEIIDSSSPAIVLATSGMLNGGPVMEYLKEWAPHPENTLIFVGYQAEGTLGKKIQQELEEIQLGGIKRENIPIRLQVVTLDGFSGHSDRGQLMRYVEKMEPKPERIILCHGEESKCLDLASSIYRKYGIETRALMNLETIRFK